MYRYTSSMDASWGMTFLLFFECWISQKWKWMEKTSWNQTLGGKHLVVEWILSLAEYVNYPLPTVPTKTSRFAEYICSLPVLIFELSCPTGYLRVKHFSLMSSRVFVAFLLCDIGANDGFNRVPGWFSWLSWYNACTELSCAIVFAMTWHRSPLLRSKRVGGVMSDFFPKAYLSLTVLPAM